MICRVTYHTVLLTISHRNRFALSKKRYLLDKIKAMISKSLIQRFIFIPLLILFITFLPIQANGEELTDAYLITEGLGIGNVLFTEKDSKAVPLVLNGDTDAEGNVSGAEPFVEISESKSRGCFKDHYHGVLLGKSDPDPSHCGWGAVTKINNEATRKIATLISSIIQKEKNSFDVEFVPSIMKNMEENVLDPKDPTTVETYLKELEELSINLEISLQEIDGAIKTVNQEADLGKMENELALSIIKKLRCAQGFDNRLKSKIKFLKKRAEDIITLFNSEGNGQRVKDGIDELINKTFKTRKTRFTVLNCKKDLVKIIGKAEAP